MRILVVEDEPGIARFLKQGLEEESYAVDIAENGRTGLDCALSGEYDLILLDWMLPGISGVEICRQLRTKDSHTPVIFLTAKDTTDEVVFGLQAGANDYVKKPFHFEEILERIRVQLRSVSSNHSKLSAGKIEMDVDAHKVFSNGDEINLTQKEFALLEYLMRNKGKVCRRTRIIESIWNHQFDYNTGVIDVYINALRKKLDLASEDIIKTVRGVGYMIDQEI
ncbi:MAG: response regulator [Bacteroidetes bacterium]|nr:response regulator [Bacteroidota bacterium]